MIRISFTECKTTQWGKMNDRQRNSGINSDKWERGGWPQWKINSLLFDFLPKQKGIYAIGAGECMYWCDGVCACTSVRVARLVHTISQNSNDRYCSYLAHAFPISREKIPMVLVEISGHVRLPKVQSRKPKRTRYFNTEMIDTFHTWQVDFSFKKETTYEFFWRSKVILGRQRWNYENLVDCK